MYYPWAATAGVNMLFLWVGAQLGCSDSSVKAVNAKPAAEISSHSDGDTVREGFPETLRAIVSDPVGPSSNSDGSIVTRGGSWAHSDKYSQVAWRTWFWEPYTSHALGFRVQTVP